MPPWWRTSSWPAAIRVDATGNSDCSFRVKAAVGHQVRRLTWSSSRSYLASLIAPQQARTRLRRRSPSPEPNLVCRPTPRSHRCMYVTRTHATMTRAPHRSAASRDAHPRLASHRSRDFSSPSSRHFVHRTPQSIPSASRTLTYACSALVPPRLLEPLNRSRPPDRPFRGEWVVGIGERAEIPAGAGRERPPTHVNRRTGRERDSGHRHGALTAAGAAVHHGR